MKKFNQVLDTTLNTIKDAKEGKIHIGFKTNWEKFDKVLGGGIKTATNLTIAARTSTGKSSFANSLILGILENNPNAIVIYWNWEMTDYQQTLRFLSNKSSKSVNELLSQTEEKLSDADIKEISNITEKFKNYNLYIEDKIINADNIIDYFVSLKNQIENANTFRPKIVNVFDHTRLVLGKNYNTEEAKIHKLFESLQVLKKSFGATNIVISQLNRDIEKEITKTKAYRSPNISDIFGADAVGQYSEVVLLLHRPELYDVQYLPKQIEYNGIKYNVPSLNKLLCLIAKNRDGNLGEIIFEHNLKFNQIEEWKTQNWLSKIQTTNTSSPTGLLFDKKQ